MGDDRTGTEREHRDEGVVLMGLHRHQDEGVDRQQVQTRVDVTHAYLIHIAGEPEMDGTHHEQYRHQQQIEQLREGEVGMLRDPLHLTETGEIGQRHRRLVGMQEQLPTGIEPVGGDQSDQRCQEGAYAQGIDRGGHQQVHRGDEQQVMGLREAHHADEQEHIERLTGSARILVAGEQQKQHERGAALEDGTRHRWEQPHRGTPQHQVGYRHRPAVDTDQQVDVVQVDHRIYRGKEAQELEPPVVLHQSGHQPHPDTIQDGDRERHSALSNLIL